MTASGSEQIVPAATVWTRVSHHLRALGDVSRTLEEAVVPGPVDSLPARTIQQLQTFDILQQTLDDLAVLAEEMGKFITPGGLDPQDRAAISERLRLAEVRALIAQSDIDLPRRPLGQTSDETVIF